jgi:hypothetical protein
MIQTYKKQRRIKGDKNQKGKKGETKEDSKKKQKVR